MIITNFAAGELSKNLFGRVDLPQYYCGASKLINWDIIPTGGIQRRKGTQRLGELSGNCRIIPFIVNKDISFILEFGPNYIKFWNKDGKITDENDNQIGFTTSSAGFALYTSLSEIKEIQYTQNYDTLIFVHRNYKPLKLKWTGGSSFSLEQMAFTFLPDEIKSDIDGYLDSDDYTDSNPPTADTDTFQTPGNYPGCCAFFNNRLFLASTTNAPQKIWASRCPDTQGNRYNNFGTHDRYLSVSKVVKDPDLHIFSGNVSIETSSTTISGLSQDLTSLLKNSITDYYISGDIIPVGTKCTGITENSVTINTTLTKNVTSEVFTIQLWKIAGNPTAEDYEYTVTDNDVTAGDCGFNFEIASDQNDCIKWIAQNRHLLVGTESSEWIIPNTITATSLFAQLNSRHGSDGLQATCIGSAVIFFAQGLRAIREYYWDADSETFTANNLAMLNKEILEESPVIDFDYITNPHTELLITKQDGTLAKLLYEKSSGVMGWCRYKLGSGNIQSCAVTRGDSYCDISFFCVKQGNNYYLEKYNLESEIYLDSYSTYSADITGYLDTATLYNATKDTTCLRSEIPTDFISADDVVYIGYSYTSTLSSMPVLDSTNSEKKRITDLILRFVDSDMPVIVNDAGQEEFITGKTVPYSGTHKITYPGNSSEDVIFTLKSDSQKAVSVLSITANLT